MTPEEQATAILKGRFIPSDEDRLAIHVGISEAIADAYTEGVKAGGAAVKKECLNAIDRWQTQERAQVPTLRHDIACLTIGHNPVALAEARARLEEAKSTEHEEGCRCKDDFLFDAQCHQCRRIAELTARVKSLTTN